MNTVFKTTTRPQASKTKLLGVAFYLSGVYLSQSPEASLHGVQPSRTAQPGRRSGEKG